jgi:hypothetical protein
MAYAPLKNTAPENDSANGIGPLTPAAGLKENRKEDRIGADGTVCLILDHDGSLAVTGRLADVSDSGFRAVHESPELRPGRVVRFRYEELRSGKRMSGWARVVWCREQDSRIETGCYVVIAD